jgi:hypothetical protein
LIGALATLGIFLVAATIGCIISHMPLDPVVDSEENSGDVDDSTDGGSSDHPVFEPPLPIREEEEDALESIYECPAVTCCERD